MVKSSSCIKLLLVLVMVMVSVVTMAPTYAPQWQIEDMSDPSKRNARSTNPSSIATGTVDKIKILINSRWLEILPNGVVYATLDETSDNGKSYDLLLPFLQRYFIDRNSTKNIYYGLFDFHLLWNFACNLDWIWTVDEMWEEQFNLWKREILGKIVRRWKR